MKKIYNLFFCILFFIATNILTAQTTVVGGMVYGNWPLSGSPYNVTGSIFIPNDSTLTIDPGVVVSFQGTFKLSVQGRLLAIGTAVDTISFTAANTTTGWRGIDFPSTTSNNDTTKIQYCKLRYGKATGANPDNEGGAIYIKSYSKVIISRCNISYCTANYAGGAIAANNNCYPIISDNKIYGNSAVNNGGGIYLYSICSPIIRNNIIVNNTADRGAGTYIAISSSPIMTNNVICNNTATSISKGGGGMFFYGNTLAMITNNTIANNAAFKGGAVYCENNDNPTYRNCIVYGNTASNAGAVGFLQDDSSDPKYYYSDVEGGTTLIDPNGNFYTGTFSNNINSVPLFVTPTGGSGTGFDGFTADWSLQVNSPCINVGDPTMITPSFDIVGNPRITVCRIDQGAYEYQNGTPFAVSISVASSIPCFGYTTGALQANAVGSGGPYTYTWTPGGSNASSITNLSAGQYTVVANNSTGCSRVATYTLTQPSGMSLTPTQSNIGCSGSCDGFAGVNVSGGTGPFTYTWTTVPAQNTANTTPTLCSGPYTVTVTDGGGCTANASVNITTPSSLSFTTVLVNVSCFGGNNGSITVNATGGVPTLQYSNNGGLSYQFSNVFSGLSQGTYSVVTKDGNGCQTSTSIVTITEPPVLTTTTSQTNLLCYGATNGTATAMPTGGTPGYTYLWIPIGGTGATGTNLSAGPYTVTVTDTKSCVTTATVNIVSTLAPPAICMLSVDSVSLNNIIYWDKTVATGIDSFIIYREVSTNVYTRIAAISKDSLSMFVDTVRSVGPANGDPNIGYYHYKIQFQDNCGTYSALSPYHTSVYFIDNFNGTFTWNLYTVEGQSTPVSNFELLRDDANTNNYLPIGSVAGTTTTLNDPSYFSYNTIANWRVDAQGFNCNPTMRYGGNNSTYAVTKSRSNIKNNRVSSIGQSMTDNLNVVLYPQPASNEVVVDLNVTQTKISYELYSILGELVQKATVQNTQTLKLNVQSLNTGIYTLVLTTDKGKTIKKLIKE